MNTTDRTMPRFQYEAWLHANRHAAWQHGETLSDCDYADSPEWQRSRVTPPTLRPLPQPARDPSGMGRLLSLQASRRFQIARICQKARQWNPREAAQLRWHVPTYLRRVAA